MSSNCYLGVRSPGGTPLRRKSTNSSFHQEMLANALFKKFQKAREDSPEGRKSSSIKRVVGEETRSSAANSTARGLSSMFDDSDDDWEDKENI